VLQVNSDFELADDLDYEPDLSSSVSEQAKRADLSRDPTPDRSVSEDGSQARSSSDHGRVCGSQPQAPDQYLPADPNEGGEQQSSDAGSDDYFDEAGVGKIVSGSNVPRPVPYGLERGFGPNRA